MPEPAHPVDPALTPEERKHRLIVACERDRAAWCDACRPQPTSPVAAAAQVFGMIEPFISLVPGLPGRWLRRLNMLARVGRSFRIFS